MCIRDRSLQYLAERHVSNVGFFPVPSSHGEYVHRQQVLPRHEVVCEAGLQLLQAKPFWWRAGGRNILVPTLYSLTDIFTGFVDVLHDGAVSLSSTTAMCFLEFGQTIIGRDVSPEDFFLHRMPRWNWHVSGGGAARHEEQQVNLKGNSERGS